MKLERINENQIRCTLTSDDLANREIKLSELAYGTEKAKDLFRDMMQQAQNELGFEADNMPLMIEAIPVSADSIVLIITKVEDPEELDTRFSRFSQSSEDTLDTGEKPQFSGADDILDLFKKVFEAKSKAKQKKGAKQSEETESADVNLIRVFDFNTLDEVIDASKGLNNYFTGRNTLYKTAKSPAYRLVLHQSDYSPEEFNKVCNILTEYGHGSAFTASAEAFMREHGEILVDAQALQNLSAL